MRVTIADDFFIKERNQTYANWQLSFWRELFQNAIDQESTEIKIKMEINGNPNVAISFADNGPGMTREVLEKVYFAIGATTKGGAGSIGGMGRARVLTCFSMPAYTIRSHNYLVEGHGGEYEIHDEKEFHHGCALTIAVDNTTMDQMTGTLKRFMQESSIRARVYLNGERLAIRCDPAGRYIRDLMVNGNSFARVSVNKSSTNHRVIVRVHGVSMYTNSTSAKAQIVVELNPETSRDVLTSNRDGLRGYYSEALSNFVQEVAVDTNAALRPRFARRTTVTRGGGLLTARAKPVETKKAQASYAAPEPMQVAARASRPETSHWDDTYAETELYGYAPNTTPDFVSWLAETFGDIFIFDETENTVIHKVIPNYIPENWKLSFLPDGRSFRKGGNIIKVLLMWKTAISYALEVGLDCMNRTNLSYGVGYVFADDRLAECRNTDNGNLFLLCPVTKEGKMAFSVRNKMSLKKMMTNAKHEVSHVAVSWHSEEYSTVRENIDELFNEAECLRRMKDALNAVPDLGDD